MMKTGGITKVRAAVLHTVMFVGLVLTCGATRYMENLDRGVVAVRTSSTQVYISWRMLGTEWGKDIGYYVYRNGVRVNSAAITASTNLTHTISSDGTYSVSAVIDGVEGEQSSAVSVWNNSSNSYLSYLIVPLNVPDGVTTPDSVTCTYSPNDCSVGDLDGDGQYEIIVKWDPSNSQDNANSGYTGNVYLDAYEMDGTFLWRIDLGVNIRAGAHYTQFMVYDLDCDGRAEVACKTAPGTIDGRGDYVLLAGDSATADYRNSSGYILSGSEYLTIFDGMTGAAMATTSYLPARGTVSNWGDSYGNRVDRFLACVAYLDGVRPSLVMCRGYYTRAVLAAWDWRGGQLTHRWTFDSSVTGNSAYAGQGNHNLSVGDVDGDEKDEIVYGACTIDDDGTGLYSTGLGHGDALHLSDMLPDRDGLEVWQCHESSPYGTSLRDAATGEILIRQTGSDDTGRACAAHIDSSYYGYQLWSSLGGVYDTTNTQISSSTPGYNFLIWWDGDLQREILDSVSSVNPKIDKWNGSGVTRLISLYNWPSSYGCQSNNTTKSNPCLSGDIIGDWREEAIYRLTDNTGLIICTTTTTTSYRFYTWMHDCQYREAIAWQNTAYNQPPHPSFYVGAGMATPPTPKIRFPVYGDLTSDDKIDSDDLLTFLGHWLAGDCSTTTWLDRDEDCAINNYEFSILAQNWLTADTIEPLSPQDVSAVGGDNFVSLSWSDNSESDLAGYNIYRSETSGGSYTQLNASPVSTSSYTDSTVTNGTTYYYVMTAVDASGNESAYSDEVSASMVPDAPTNLQATAIDGQVVLDWDDNAETDMAGYNVYRATVSGGSYTQINSALVSTSDYTDSTVTNGTTYYYVVTAVDTAGNESGCSDEASATPNTTTSITIQESTTGFCSVDGTIDSNNSGFTGTGFANTTNASGSGITWSVSVPAAGTYTLTWQYANGSSDRPANVLINGTTQVSALSFPATGAWTTWTSVSTSVTLSAGTNTIRLEATGSGGLANIDYITVTGSSPQPVSCS